jgi:uncharacterized membrane protein YkoI
MKHVLKILLVALVLSAGAVLPGAAPAQAASGTFRVAADNGRVSLSEAIAIVKRRYGDVEVIRAETKGRGEKAEHRIRILTKSGRVREVRVNARTGEIR